MACGYYVSIRILNLGLNTGDSYLDRSTLVESLLYFVERVFEVPDSLFVLVSADSVQCSP